jgi:hypothetical protein
MHGKGRAIGVPSGSRVDEHRAISYVSVQAVASFSRFGPAHVIAVQLCDGTDKSHCK